MASLAEDLNWSRRTLSDGAYQDALSWCHTILQYYPKCLEAYTILAQALLETGQMREAEETLRRVVSADPENALSHQKLGLLFQQRGETGEALWELLISRELEPDHPEIRELIEKLTPDARWLAGPSPGMLGRLYMRQGLYSRAVAEFRTILAEQPHRLDLQVALLESLWRMGEYEEAEEVCRRVLQDSPDCLKALLLLGEINRGNPLAGEEGRRLWEEAKALDPLNTMARQLFAATPIAALFPEMGMEIEEVTEVVVPAEEAAPVDKTLRVEEELAVAELEAPTLEIPIEEREEVAAEITEMEVAAEKEEALAAQLPAEEELLPPLEPAVEEARPSEEREEELPSWLAEGVEEEAKEKEAEVEEMPPLPEFELPPLPQAEVEEIKEIVEEVREEGPPPREIAELLGETVPEWLAEAPGPAVEAEEAKVEEVAEAPEWFPQAPIRPQGLELLDEQVRQAEERLRAEPASIEDRLALADLYVRAGRFEDALNSYRDILRVGPEVLDRVVAGIQDLVRADPTNSENHRVLGDAYVKAGRFKEAIQEYAAALPPQRPQ